MPIKKCPFCGGTPYAPCFVEATKSWHLNHACGNPEEDGLTGFISIYGDTEEEVINRWNNRISE